MLAREDSRGLKLLSYHLFFTLPVLLVLAVACWSAPAMPSPARSAASDREAILALMAAEAEAAVYDDAARLLALWAADGFVRDVNHTPADPSDDYTWIGHDAILSRYLTVVFPLYLTQLVRSDVLLTVEGDTAMAIATTVIEGEVSPGGERWTFAYVEGEWRITSITFNLEPIG